MCSAEQQAGGSGGDASPSFVVINQKGIDPGSLDLLARVCVGVCVGGWGGGGYPAPAGCDRSPGAAGCYAPAPSSREHVPLARSPPAARPPARPPQEGILALRRAKRRNMERLQLACGGYVVNSGARPPRLALPPKPPAPLRARLPPPATLPKKGKNRLGP